MTLWRRPWFWVAVVALVVLLWWGGPIVVDLATAGRRLTKTTLDEDGTVRNDPENLAAAAAAVMGRPVSLDAYALARMVRSEDARAAASVKQLVGHVAINEARRRGTTVAELLLRSTVASRNGFFGRQRSRYAATSADPYEVDLLVAEAALEEDRQGYDPTGGALKFVHPAAFGVQAGTGTYADTVAKWAAEGYHPAIVPGAPSSIVFFRKGVA